MKNITDYTGQKFNYLTAIKFIKKGRWGAKWLFRCDCGKEIECNSTTVKKGDRTSCGCKRAKDISNKKFGKLKPIKVAYLDHKGAHWECKCDCGNIKIASRFDLISGGSKSCGCSRKESLIRANKLRTQENYSPPFKGKLFISGTQFGTIKGNALRRNIEFSISIDDLIELAENQKFKCALSGIELIFSNKYTIKKTASLDRIDSGKGYINGNIQWVHKDLNFMKSDFNQDRFIELCKAVAFNNPSY
jgi:hypothetical protein